MRKALPISLLVATGQKAGCFPSGSYGYNEKAKIPYPYWESCPCSSVLPELAWPNSSQNKKKSRRSENISCHMNVV
jgi:hypothetical protein